MTHDEHPDDSVLTRELRDLLSELAVPERPPLAAITSRGRAHQRRRLAGFAGLGGAAAAAGTALAIGLTGVLGAAPARSTGTIQDAAPTRGSGSTGTIRTAAPTRGSGSTGTIRTAAFTLTSNANGTDTLTLTHSQMFDPAALQRALTQHGIPALVKSGTYCSSSPAAPDPVGAGVLTVRPPVSQPHAAMRVSAGQQPGNADRIAARTVTVINSAAIPSGTELFFGYSSSDQALFSDLIYTNSYTCSSGQPPAIP